MPYIIKNGLTYTGNLMPITQVQYDALSEAEKNSGIAYFIVDSDAVLDASDVGLGEGNVEDLAGSVAVIESSPATATHAVGSYIVWNGQLYSVIDAIQVGQALTVGSNITATSAGSEISALKSGLTDVTEERISFTYDGKTVNFYFRKIGNVVSVLFTKDDSSMTLPTTWTRIGTLTNIKAPSGSNRYIPFVSANGLTGTFRLWDDGAVILLAHSSSAYWMQSSGTVVL